MILHIGDKYSRIVDVMNNCFGWSYKACFRGWYQLNKYKKTGVWFPKIADLSSGKPEPGDKWYGWCNTMSDEGDMIYMNNFEDPNRLNMEMPDGIEPSIKLPKSMEYQYAGVFTRKYRDAEKGWVYERIARDVDTKDYM